MSAGSGIIRILQEIIESAIYTNVIASTTLPNGDTKKNRKPVDNNWDRPIEERNPGTQTAGEDQQ